ncbi:hypothetical protein [Streptomyces coeruleorubidus]|uniref:hypothetical protein n=1 Tax=Streptomyces coeruleorubidus TaxID=116188 RepID=UPI003403E80B
MSIVDAQGKPLPRGVELPSKQLRESEPGKEHLLLRDVRQVIRGGDFMKITLRFVVSAWFPCGAWLQEG